MPCDDCSRAEGCPPCVNEPEGSDDSSTERCVCGHLRIDHHWRAAHGEACIGNRNLCSCRMFRRSEEQPLAPEEQASCPTCGTTAVCKGCGACAPAEDLCDDCKAKGEAQPLPPQPLRRPPYAVAYSVAGHLYEIALPGDATVHATDGGLIITHTLGPVAGVVRVHPIEGEQSA